MKQYDCIIMTFAEINEICDGEIKFNEKGFICYEQDVKYDFLNKLQTHLNRPIVSIRPSGRESWSEVLVLCAKGHMSEDGVPILSYDDFEELSNVLTDIFFESEIDEYAVFDGLGFDCSAEMVQRITKWVHDTW